MSRRDIEEEIQYQKLKGMPRYTEPPKKRSFWRMVRAVIIITILILGFIAIAKSGLKFGF